MSIQIIPVEEQERGEFNYGAILENKPIAFPSEGGRIKPYSNLFYWAHAWSDSGSLLGEHPHQGFEIMSFVIKGNIEHYDSKNKAWFPLSQGDAQIIRAGNGISHAENFLAGSHIFQIWIDPNLELSLKHPASYDDYKSDSFAFEQIGSIKAKIYKSGEKGIQMNSEGVEILELILSEGQHTFDIGSDKILSGYLIEGSMLLDSYPIDKDGFAIIKDTDVININAFSESRFFVIISPSKLSHKTYFELFKR